MKWLQIRNETTQNIEWQGLVYLIYGVVLDKDVIIKTIKVIIIIDDVEYLMIESEKCLIIFMKICDEDILNEPR